MPRGRPLVARVTVACFSCGKEFEKRQSDAARNISQRFFCSNKCLRKVGAKPRRRADRECEWCGEQFYPRWAANDAKRFCSVACFNKWQARNRVERVCETCGKTFDRPPSWETRQAARWCSRVCAAAARIKRPLDRMHNGKPAVVDSNGYVRVYEPNHPRATKAGWQFEHRLVVEQTLGRRLTTDEHVHHINGNKSDNRPENLAVMSHGEHSSITGLLNGERLREWEEYRRRFGPLE